MEDIANILAFEIKKEIAERYFGFRTQIELDSKEYMQQVKSYAVEFENRIGYDLLRLYILLGSEKLIHIFIVSIGLPEGFYFDPYILKSSTIKERLFSDVTPRGFSQKSKHCNFMFKTYISLCENIDKYRRIHLVLSKEHENICKQISAFSRNNDLELIFSFIRQFEDSDPGRTASLLDGAPPGSNGQFYEELSIQPPPNTEQSLSLLPQLPPIKQIKPVLKQLTIRSLLLTRPSIFKHRNL